MIGSLILGFLAGTIAALAFFYVSGAIFAALAVYSGVGSATMFAASTLRHLAQQRQAHSFG
jgi:hypothetical protein